ncbi:hypothetical protein YC2023_002790 [Brassica napus]
MAASSLLSLPNFVISDMDKSRMTNNATFSISKAMRVHSQFPRLSSRGGKNHNLRVEATRSFSVVAVSKTLAVVSGQSCRAFSVVAVSKTLAVV